jgi:hypothetical protein
MKDPGGVKSKHLQYSSENQAKFNNLTFKVKIIECEGPMGGCIQVWRQTIQKYLQQIIGFVLPWGRFDMDLFGIYHYNDLSVLYYALSLAGIGERHFQ